MKIAFIVGVFPKISETFILNQITGLVDRGHDVVILPSSKIKEEKVHSAVKQYNLLDKTYYYLPKNKFSRIVRALIIIIINLFKNPQAILKSLNIFKYGKKALSLELLFLTNYFIKKDFDIITCHFGPNGITGAYLKDIGVRGKIITTFHAYDLTKYTRKEGENVYKFLFTKGDLFLSISKYWVKRIVELGGSPQKIVIHRMGIETKKFSFVERKIKEGGKIRILTVGRLVEKKGHKYMIEAIKKISEKYKNVEYIIAGDGPLLLELKTLVKKLDIEECVIFLGTVNQEEAINLYYKSHIFALTSITAENRDQEGIPVVLMEASATGLPIISTHHTGISEVVIDKKTGFLVDEKDVNGLIGKLKHLIENHELREKMGKNGRKLIEKQYNIEGLNDKLVEVYENCLKK